MKDVRRKDERYPVDDKVAEALERLAVVLAEARMSATVTLQGSGSEGTMEFTLGMEQGSAPHHVVHAKSATGEPSHLGIDDL